MAADLKDIMKTQDKQRKYNILVSCSEPIKMNDETYGEWYSTRITFNKYNGAGMVLKRRPNGTSPIRSFCDESECFKLNDMWCTDGVITVGAYHPEKFETLHTALYDFLKNPPPFPVAAAATSKTQKTPSVTKNTRTTPHYNSFAVLNEVDEEENPSKPPSKQRPNVIRMGPSSRIRDLKKERWERMERWAAENSSVTEGR
jgi:hypothetical protein